MATDVALQSATHINVKRIAMCHLAQRTLLLLDEATSPKAKPWCKPRAANYAGLHHAVIADRLVR
jgi:hypothetical protein